MIFFGKKGDYIKFSEVISILEDERAKHHYASRSSLDQRSAVGEAIKSLKRHHIKNNPKRYMVWRQVFNAEAEYLMQSKELKDGEE